MGDYNRLKKLMGENSISQDDFTKSGEQIPKDAGPLDFVKYNIAHRDPIKLALEMGMVGGGIAKPAGTIPKVVTQEMVKHPNWLKGITHPSATPEVDPGALERAIGTAENFKGEVGSLREPPKPALSIGPLKEMENAARIRNEYSEIPGFVPKEYSPPKPSPMNIPSDTVPEINPKDLAAALRKR